MKNDENKERDFISADFFDFEDEDTVQKAFPDEEKSEEDEKRKKKYIKIGLITAGVILLILIIFYVWGVIFFRDHFLPGTEVNGVYVGMMTENEALDTLNQSFTQRSVKIVGDKESDTVTGQDIGLTFDNDLGDLSKLIDEQKRYSWQFQALTHRAIDLSTDYKVDDTKLKQVVEGLSLVSGPNVVAPKDASISYNGNEFVINKQEDGNQPNVDKLEKVIVKDLVQGEQTINLSKDNLYNRPSITSDNETLKQELDEFNKAIQAKITLNFPNEQVVLDKQIFNGWLSAQDGKVVVGDQVNTYTAQLAERFDNNGVDIPFKATNGNTYHFKYNAGWVLNQQAQADQLKSQILDGQVITEDPQWSQRGEGAIVGNSIGNNYIEISLANQMIWLYRNGALISSSTMVSGNVGSNQSTGTGLFFLESKETNVNIYVRKPNGYDENIQVKYWLPYSRHFGIESASWRDAFGGDIYRTQGTNGDIDVPVDMAATIYNNADVGIPVVIY